MNHQWCQQNNLIIIVDSDAGEAAAGPLDSGLRPEVTQQADFAIAWHLPFLVSHFPHAATCPSCPTC